jgi:hypothetical protein
VTLTPRLASTASATLSFVPESDVVLTGAIAAGAYAVISFDSAQTYAKVYTPAAGQGGLFKDFCIPVATNTFVGNLNIPVSKGRTIYVANSGACSVVLLLEETFE